MDVTSVTNAVSAAVTDAVTESIPEGYVTVREFLYKGWLGLLAEKGEIPLWLWISAIVFCAVLGYLLGSINCAVVISKLKYGDDIRKHGSGNAGATNMSRTYGKSAGIATLLGDVLKTVAAVRGHEKQVLRVTLFDKNTVTAAVFADLIKTGIRKIGRHRNAPRRRTENRCRSLSRKIPLRRRYRIYDGNVLRPRSCLPVLLRLPRRQMRCGYRGNGACA